jgi:hypothetical protein
MGDGEENQGKDQPASIYDARSDDSAAVAKENGRH